MDNFQKDIDDRANLTLSNRFELLLFRLVHRCMNRSQSCSASMYLSCAKSYQCPPLRARQA